MSITSGGIPGTRVHVLNPRDWGTAAATDFWANWGNLDIIPTGAEDLEDHGWLASAFTHIAGSGSDLMDSADVGALGGINFGTASDYIISPFIFGDYPHARMVQDLLGYLPTTLNMEIFTRFAANNDEEETGFGWVIAGTNDNALVKSDLEAFITSDGTNFSLESASAAATSIDLDDTVSHVFKIVMLKGAAIDWYIDDTLQTNTLALVNDVFPVAFAAGTKATTGANDPVISWVHIWYS